MENLHGWDGGLRAWVCGQSRERRCVTLDNDMNDASTHSQKELTACSTSFSVSPAGKCGVGASDGGVWITSEQSTI